jgi:hypothetical protein
MKCLTSLVTTACASAMLLAIGCNRNDTPVAPPATPPANTSAQANAAPPTPATQDPPSTLTAPMPPPNAPQGDASSGPKPGQANDHSSPAFKGGGKEVPK